jgi:hypothetical protein
VNDKLETRAPTALKEKGQYLLAFGLVAVMLLVAQFPLFVVFFFGVFAYFLFRMFAAGSRNDTREIFEFYLTANEVLRDDERRWYGFEIHEAIRRGESILQRMSTAPPLIHFSLGALYNKVGDHGSAAKHLAYIVENANSDESSLVYPTPELRNYVKVLRKIERDPADAPMTSAAVRALERARKLRSKILLEDSRSKVPPAPAEPVEAKSPDRGEVLPLPQPAIEVAENGQHEKPPLRFADIRQENKPQRPRERKKEKVDPFSDRKSISEVLHDIYDKNVQ